MHKKLLTSIIILLLILLVGCTQPSVPVETPQEPGSTEPFQEVETEVTPEPVQGHTRIAETEEMVVAYPSRKIIKNGESDSVPLAIKNDQASEQTFTIDVTSQEDWSTIEPQLTLTPNELKTIPLTISVPGDATAGVYTFEITVKLNGETYGTPQNVYVKVE